MPRAFAYLFPGQGSQYVGMGKAVREASPTARKVYEQADDLLGYSITQLSLEGPEDKLRDTANAQPAIFTASIAALKALRDDAGFALNPSFVAGHSLGEFTALVAAGVLNFEDGLRLVQRRGELMSKANLVRPGTMAAVLGLPEAEVETACADAADAGSVVVANYNSAGQTVISGEPAAVARAGELAKGMGAKRVVPLPVGAAFHSPLMQFALEPFTEAIDACALADPAIPVIGNVSAQLLTTASEVRDEITRQVASPVRWTDTMTHLVEQGVELVVEVGPGQVLAGLAKRVQGLRVANVEDVAAARAFVTTWEGLS